MATSSAKAAPSYSPAAQAALLKAANRVFDLENAVNSLDDLVNGVVLGNILHEMDSEFDPSHLETTTTTSKYLTNKRNLQTVYKGLFRFIRRQIPALTCQAKKYDYHAIADSPDAQGISQLLAVMVATATLGPDGGKYVPRIQNSLDNHTMNEIMQIIQAIQTDMNNFKDDEGVEETMEAIMGARDMDLVVEEQNAELRSQLEVTKKKLSDYITRLEYLQSSHEELKYEKEKNDRELEILRKATQDGASNAEAIKALEDQVHEQMEIISRYEETIANNDKVKAHLESEVQRLTQRSILADELRDQVAEWKHKSEEFEKRANTADRYKQKLEQNQHLEKELQNLQYERAELQEQLRSVVVDQKRDAQSRKTEEELTKMVTQSEQHLWDERHQKTQLLRDFAALEEKVFSMENQRIHDENFIQDLQEQLQQGTSRGGVPQGDTPIGRVLNLEDELNNASDDGRTNIPLEYSRLKAENDMLRRTMGSSGDNAALRRELDDATARADRIQDSFNEMFEKNAVAQSQIEALMEDMTGEGTQAFANLRAQNVEKTAELEKARRRITELEAQNADQSRELLTLRTDLSAVEKDSGEALAQLKNTDELVSKSLEAELTRVRERLAAVTNEHDAQKSQLIEALLAKEKLRKDAQDGKDISEVITKDPDASEAAKKETEKIEKLRARLVERNEQLEKSEQQRVDMQRQLKAALGGEAAAAQKAASDQIIKNLQRENGLMATAWYDLTSRLQSNHVILQRRPEAPKSWLNKQRQMVNATPRK